MHVVNRQTTKQMFQTSIAKMEEKYGVTCDSAVESVIKVHTKNGIIKFLRSAEGLYYYKTGYKSGGIKVQMV